MKLSICMMVKDEEKNLKRCLDKLTTIINSGLAELIIVDTGSKDNTPLIAKEYTNNLYFHKWNKDFSEMRNKSISYAKGEWIFIIDADERLDDVEELICLLKSKELEKCNTVLLQVKNLYDYKDEKRYNVMPSPRIFRNDGEFKYIGAVHNQPIFKEPNLNVDISLTHFGYISTDKELMERKYKRTVELLKSELKKTPENLYYIYQLGISYDMHSDHKESLAEFRKAYEILKNKDLLNDNTYTYILSSYCRISYTNNELEESLSIANHVIALEPEYVDMYYIKGLIENQLGNTEQAFNYFCKYIDLSEKYYDLKISEDLTIIMYHMDKNSISNAYFEIYKYHLKQKNYSEAYKLYEKIIIVDQKIYSGINLLLKMKKYNELKVLYFSLEEKQQRDSFLLMLEDEINKLENEERKEIYKELILENELYGELNKLRLIKDKKEKEKIAKLLLENIDFNKEALFYSEIFNYIDNDMYLIISYFSKIEIFTLKKMVQHIIEKNKEMIQQFEECILNCKEDLLDLDQIKSYITITYVLLLFNASKCSEINEKYQDIFKIYLNLGDKFVCSIYQMNKVESIYKYASNIEDRFFLIMYLVNFNLKNGNRKVAINYIIEAINTYEAMAKYIDYYKNTILGIENKDARENEEFEKYKIKIKDNINKLINNGQLDDAKLLLTEYKSIIKNDIEIYSIESVIYILENKLENAENVLKQGLAKDPYNKDILLNMSYLMNQANEYNKSVEYVCKAKLFNEEDSINISDFICDIKPIDNTSLKVIQGTIEIANQMNTVNNGLKELGVQSQTLNYYPTYLKYKSDYEIDINSFRNKTEADIEIKKIVPNIIANNDIFHLHFGTSLTLDYSDLPLLKDLGKKVVMQYWGSDVRMYSKAIKMNPYAIAKNMNEELIKRRLEFISKYIPDCIVDYELAEYVKDYHSNIYYTRVAIDLNKYKYIEKVENKKMLIVHAPTSAEVKGTKYILKAIEDLKEKYDFDFKLVQGMTHEEAKKIYEEADLIIDQVLCGGYGVFAVEAMSMGKPVICWISDFMKEKYPEELPIISANPENIKEKIEYSIKNKDMLSDIGKKGRKYVEKYHDKEIISKNILEIYKKL
ncbi:TPA: glycosyltransferase [Clostridium botulinum]|nr:glycosyltransferase [Clostridium botulinum]